jgi:hypothetical protein
VDARREPDDAVRLHWIPVGAGGHVVARSSGLYERVAAWHEHRPRLQLVHAALTVRRGGAEYAVEMTPAWGNGAAERGVVAQGPVGWAPLGRSPYFRYEVRAWRGGTIPDLAWARATVEVPTDPYRVERLLTRVREVPPLTWGRDELGLGEMWNSNSIVACLLATSGHDVTRSLPPAGTRAPGWDSGLALTDRWTHSASPCPAAP